MLVALLIKVLKPPCLPRGTKKGLSISPPGYFHKLAPGWLHRGRGGFKLSGMLEEVSLNTSANFGAFVIRNTGDKGGGAIWPPAAGNRYIHIPAGNRVKL